MRRDIRNHTKSRREFIRDLGLLTATFESVRGSQLLSASTSGMRMGLVTYLWGKDWTLPDLISLCEQGGMSGVELRTQHAHGVEPVLTLAERREVRKRFDNSPVTCVGYGSNQEYHLSDQTELKKNIEGTYELVKLCHDIGATGVKVKPNTIPDGVPREKTIAQIGASLNNVGRFAADYGQKIRVEVHGKITAELPVIKAIFDHVEESNVGICWNCNEQDLLPPGIESNFASVRDRFADTVHVREFDSKNYPYKKLFKMLVETDFRGWILLEGREIPADPVPAMKKQVRLFEDLVRQAKTH